MKSLRELKLRMGPPWISLPTEPQSCQEAFSLDALFEIASQFQGPWILAGDFNAILSHEDIRGGYDRRIEGCPLFQNFMQLTSLHDLGFTGPWFTWKRGLLLQCLDRVVRNGDWLDLYPRTVIQHLPRIKSDHRAMLISFNRAPLVVTSPKPFKFLRVWMDHSKYEKLIDSLWDPTACLEKKYTCPLS